ncbi:hypothetical protein [Paraburkholderia bannensis]|uniref:hypothetical protein n=1 Tax=Paraburkholderia bannensis TaxID=765414 RepID=UPI002AB79D6A|nr:hypothetical protein [Paraburkholderia bannensis]
MSELAIEVEEGLPEAACCFGSVTYHGVQWDLSHLDPFAFRIDPGLGTMLTVVVVFSCHCFSHSIRRDTRALSEIPGNEIYDDGRERRVLDAQRFALSRRFLRAIVKSLHARRITIADRRQPNFVTLDTVNADGTISHYAVFFEVERDRQRKRRMFLRIQSAYLLDGGLTRRQASAGKVRFDTLLRNAYQGKKIGR